MEKNFNLKVLNIIAGSKYGGAEIFFERLAKSFEKNRNIKQKIILRSANDRFANLKKIIPDVEQIKLFNNINLFCHFKIESIIKNFGPDIILTWMNRASKLLPYKKFKNEVRVGRLGGYYKIKNYLKCDYLVTNTLDIRKYVISQGWDNKKVEFIPNFVPENKSIVNKSTNKNKIKLLCMGRFHENKAFETLIRGMSFLPSYELSIVGSGQLKGLYELLIKKYKLSNRVKIYNWSNDISEFLNKSSILVCPSRHEPFGNIIIDGWAHKIPVVASNTGGPAKMIKHKYNGMKFEKDNVFDLTTKIKEIVSNPILKNKITKNGYNSFKINYSEDVIVQKYISFFNKISRICAE